MTTENNSIQDETAAEDSETGREETDRVKTRALRMLARRDYSRGELVRRLTDKGEDETVSETVADWIIEMGYINDSRYAAEIVRSYSERGYGPAKVRDELFRRWIPRELWDDALEQIPESGDTIDRLLLAKLGAWTDDRREQKRATDYLRRRGYGWDEIRGALSRLEEESEN